MEQFYRSTAALEAIARKVLKEFDPALLYGPPQAVPIEKLATHLGITIEFQCIRKNGLILGEMVYDKTYVPLYFRDVKRYELILVDGGTMFLDESLLRCRDDGRLNFTCGHETAHWLLDKDIYAGTGQAAASGHPKKSSEENPAVERQANRLSSMLLLPTAQVKRAFYAVRNKPEPVMRLKEHFQVSKEVMDIFMREHNLI
jgi:hypothetical protein